MEVIIKKIQELLYNSSVFSEQEKKKYFMRLEMLKEVEDDKTKETMRELFTRMEKDPNVIKEFFYGIDKTMKAYIKEGGKGIINVLDQEIAKAE